MSLQGLSEKIDISPLTAAMIAGLTAFSCHSLVDGRLRARLEGASYAEYEAEQATQVEITTPDSLHGHRNQLAIEEDSLDERISQFSYVYQEVEDNADELDDAMAYVDTVRFVSLADTSTGVLGEAGKNTLTWYDEVTPGAVAHELAHIHNSNTGVKERWQVLPHKKKKAPVPYKIDSVPSFSAVYEGSDWEDIDSTYADSLGVAHNYGAKNVEEDIATMMGFVYRANYEPDSTTNKVLRSGSEQWSSTLSDKLSFLEANDFASSSEVTEARDHLP